MLELLSPAALDAYHDHVVEYHNIYGNAVWLLLYQADIRFRVEHADRVRRRMGNVVSRLQDPNAHEYDKDHPWEYAWLHVADEVQFWTTNFERAAVLIATRVSSLGSHLSISELGALLNGVSATSPSSASGAARGQGAHGGGNPPPTRPGKPDKKRKAPPDRAPPKADTKGGGDKSQQVRGVWVNNTAGYPLCNAF
jgi:hypothetical protein